MNARHAHYLEPLRSDGIPARHVIFDTEAKRHLSDRGERQELALAVAEFHRWPASASSPEPEPVTYSDAGELWADVAAFTRNKHRTVVWAHNLAYDLRLSRALVELPALGFSLSGIVLEHQASWAVFRGHARTILCCDLATWLPTGLQQIAKDLGEHHLSFTRGVPREDQLAERCRGDVVVTRRAVIELLDLVRGQHLGPWRQTGAGQSHAAWRRRWLKDRPLVHDSEDTLAAERRAMWTGRCEAWRWGRITDGGVHEYDLQLAYPNIAATEHLPAQLIGQTSATHGWQVIPAMDRHAVLAEVDVQSDLELAPCEAGDLIHWPVGAYTTTLWDPELRLLYERGAKVTVRRCWLYRRGPVLADFSRWLLTQLRSDSSHLSPVQRRALKHMARTVIGRCALRYRSWEPYGTVPDFGLRLGELHDLQTGEFSELLHVGHDLLTLGEQVEAEDSLPQITGYVMSEARARLWRLIELADPANVLYVDTDSIIVNDAGAAVLNELIDIGQALSLEHKGTHAFAVILGPRQLQLGRERRLAGVPLKATETAPGVFEGEVWRSIRESVARGEGASVVLERKRWELAGVDNRRAHLADGSTAAHRVGSPDA